MRRLLLASALALLAPAPAAANHDWSRLVTVDVATGRQHTLKDGAVGPLCWGPRGVEALTHRRGLVVAAHRGGRRPLVVLRFPSTPREERAVVAAERSPGCAATAAFEDTFFAAGSAVRLLDPSGAETLRVPLPSSLEDAPPRLGWSTDGSRVAVVLGPLEERRLQVHEVATGRALLTRPVSERLHLPARPFSPDGGRLAVLDRDDDDSPLRLDVIDVATGAARTLATPPSRRRSYGEAAWSPRTEQIALVGHRAIELIDAVSGARAVVPAGLLAPDAEPAWSPDGTRLGYLWSHWWTGRRGLSVVDVTPGARPRTLTQVEDIQERAPVWSPDGRALAFAVETDGGPLG